jgi:hypothetical protein
MFSLLSTLIAFGIAQRARFQYETRHWLPLWKICAAVAGSLIAGLIFLQSLDLLDDFISLFKR